MTSIAPLPRPTVLDDHLDAAILAVHDLRRVLPTIAAWGERLAYTLTSGARLLAAGNGGSAAQAQHLTSELVGRFQDDRRPFSAICLSAETSSLTAIGNDYGFDHSFARQVEAHAREGDVVLLLSTSGQSPNLLAAARAAQAARSSVWAITGPVPNPLSGAVDECIDVRAPTTAAIQEAHQVVVHLLCRAFEERLPAPAPVIVPASRFGGR
jgi:phosphoheptose isomerase